METKLSYEKAYEELKKISQDIENESISIDILSERVKRAAFLIEYCQQKLRSTDQEVQNIINQMNSSEEKTGKKKSNT